jgi:hypothetical protein
MMELKHFFNLGLLLFSLPLVGQMNVPYNTAIQSDLEKSVLQTISENELVDPFLLQASVNHDPLMSLVQYEQEFNEFVDYLREKKEKGGVGVDFFEATYYKTHKKFLKKYTPYSSFGELLRTGSYDCLSATIFYALLLDKLEIPFDVVETEYHIYLLIYENNHQYMFETTDPLYGFVSDPEVIKQRIEEINSQNDALASNYLTLQKDARFISDFHKLAGLQYFNAAVNALRNENIIASIDQLEKARLLDNSDRFKEFGKYLARLVIDEESLSAEEKQKYLMKLTHFLNSGALTASL